jgi:hypothetical protein
MLSKLRFGSGVSGSLAIQSRWFDAQAFLMVANDALKRVRKSACSPLATAGALP